ncbi:MAG: hypothetical protein PUE08_07805 [Eubacteriales bacterium]|nr:hypothetical protein [Eubacteriales bacterium]
MLKVNNECMVTACSELKQCSSRLSGRYEQLEIAYSYLKNNSSLEDEAAALLKIMRDIEEEINKTSKLIKVLDYSSYEYGLCEERVCTFTEEVKRLQPKKYRLDKTSFEFSAKRVYSWK